MLWRPLRRWPRSSGNLDDSFPSLSLLNSSSRATPLRRRQNLAGPIIEKNCDGIVNTKLQCVTDIAGKRLGEGGWAGKKFPEHGIATRPASDKHHLLGSGAIIPPLLASVNLTAVAYFVKPIQRPNPTMKIHRTSDSPPASFAANGMGPSRFQ